MSRNRAFTIVEVLVIITVIVVLAAISILAFSRVQLQARDTKRQSDARALKSSLEKYFESNGEYPSSCPPVNYNTTTFECSHRPLTNLRPSNNPPINQNTSNSVLGSILRTNTNDVRDPMATGTNPFGAPSASGTTNQYFYLYIGDMTNQNATTLTNVRPFRLNINGISCEYQVTVAAGRQTSFVLAYYSEADNKIHMVVGDRNAKPTIPSGQPCVIEQI